MHSLEWLKQLRLEIIGNCFNKMKYNAFKQIIYYKGIFIPNSKLTLIYRTLNKGFYKQVTFFLSSHATLKCIPFQIQRDPLIVFEISFDLLFHFRMMFKFSYPFNLKIV